MIKGQMSILKSEKFMAAIIVERDEIIEGLISQVDQVGKQINQMRQENQELTKRLEGTTGQCEKATAPPTM